MVPFRSLQLYFALLLTVGIAAGISPRAVAQNSNSDRAYTPADEKRSRTPAQRKIDSQLLYAIKQRRGDTRGVPQLPIEINLDSRNRIVVDVTAKVPARVVPAVERLGGSVISVSAKYHTLQVALQLEKLEALASSKHVIHIRLPATPATHGPMTKQTKP